MSLPLVVVRPEPGLNSTVLLAREHGIPAIGQPLSEIKAHPWEPVVADSVDALLIGSANAVRLAGPQLSSFLSKPVYAVGEATAAAARSAGLRVAAVGTGGLQGVLDAIPAPTRLLRLAGDERVRLVSPAGVTVTERVVYGATPLPMSSATAEVLAGGAVVVLHSAASARHFAAEGDRHGIDRGRVVIAALGSRILAAAGNGWLKAQAAAEPTEAALLSLAAELCHVQGGPGER